MMAGDLRTSGDVVRIRVHWFDLDVASAGEAHLSEAERRRAERFHHSQDRRRYVAAHHRMRTLLARELGDDPNRLQFGEGQHGKPFLLRRRLQFNLTHSHQFGGLALTNAGPVGLDCERKDALADLESLAREVFAPDEMDAFRGLSADRQGPFFYCVWTRKEAILKATGLGVTFPLRTVSVVGFEGAMGAVNVPGHGAWWVRDINAPAGFAAAASAQGPFRARVTWDLASPRLGDGTLGEAEIGRRNVGRRLVVQQATLKSDLA